MDALGDLGSLFAKGGAGITALWLILKYRPWQQRRETVSFWKETTRDIVKETLQEEFEKRNEKIREIIRDELEAFFRGIRR